MLRIASEKDLNEVKINLEKNRNCKKNSNT